MILVEVSLPLTEYDGDLRQLLGSLRGIDFAQQRLAPVSSLIREPGRDKPPNFQPPTVLGV